MSQQLFTVTHASVAKPVGITQSFQTNSGSKIAAIPTAVVGASKQARPAQVKMSLGASANNGVVGFSMKGNTTPLKAESNGSSMMSMATKVSQTPRSGNLQMKMSAMPSSQSSGFGVQVSDINICLIGYIGLIRSICSVQINQFNRSLYLEPETLFMTSAASERHFRYLQ